MALSLLGGGAGVLLGALVVLLYAAWQGWPAVIPLAAAASAAASWWAWPQASTRPCARPG